MTPPKKKATPKKKEASKPPLPVPALGRPVPYGKQDEFPLGSEVTVLFPLVEFSPPSWSLPPFSGHKTRCIKCGTLDEDGVTVRVDYHASVEPTSPCWAVYMGQEPGMAAKRAEVPFPEHLDRRCSNCRYAWVEAIAPPMIFED